MPEPDIEVAVRFAIAQSGKPYHAYGARFGPDYFDCSGLVIRALAEAGVPFPPGISPANGWGNTVSIYNWAKDVGALVSVQKAVATRGAILLRGRWWGNGPLGHIEFSLGNGREVGAHSSSSGIGERASDPTRYHDGVIFPFVHYGALAPPVDPAALEYLAKLTRWEKTFSEPDSPDGRHGVLKRGDTNGRVTTLVELLIHFGYLGPGRQTNTYGRHVQTAVGNFKKAARLSGGGRKFGPDAAAALLRPR